MSNKTKKKMNHYDVVVLGGGPMGLATAAELSKSDKETLLIEKFGFINQNGSSAGLSRQFRVQYAQKYMAQLALDSIPYWEDLQKTTEEVLVDTVGSLWFGDPTLSSQEGGIQAAMNVMDELDIPYEPLNSTQIEERFPFKDIPADYNGFFQKDGGIIDLAATQRALLSICESASNVTLMDNSPVTNIQSMGNGLIIVSIDGQRFTTEKLVISPGAYINEILNHFDLSVDVDIWEMSSAYYKKTEDITLPTWFVFQKPQNTSLFYGFPEVDWAHPGYIRVAPDIPDSIIKDPSQRSPKPSKRSLGLNEAWVRDHMVGLSPESEFTGTCLITLSNNDKELLLDSLPPSVHNNENIIVYTGGWAAKFVPLLGKILSDLALTGSTAYDVSNFKIDYKPSVKVKNKELKNLNLKSNLPSNKAIEVAVIGAGVSGLYTAYRLTNDADSPLPADQVQIFELSDRIGGRLESVELPGMSISGELGGMRYMTSQEIVTAMIEDLFKDELTNIPFPMGDDANHFGYFRKQRVKMDAWENAQSEGSELKTNYILNKGDVGYSADQLFNKVIYDVLTADPWFGKRYGKLVSNPKKYEYTFKITREQWNDIKPNLTYHFPGPYEGLKVNDIGFWNLIKDRVSQEGYTFLAQAGGYYSNTINWNAAEAFPYMVGDFSNAGSEYKTIDGGYDLIAYAIANGYLKNAGANIWMGNRLVTFKKQRSGAYKYLLEFYNYETKSSWMLEANKIVLAMPRRSLELLDQNNFFFDQDTQKVLQKNIASVIKEPSLKILMGFETPWWKEDFGTLAGHSITDLPLRQCYYFGTDPNNSHSLFLGSYNDMRTVTFWQALANSRRKGGIMRKLFQPRETKLVLRSAYNDHLLSNQATQVMVDEAMNQVRELHGRENIPMPFVTWYKDWSADPYGGGYHAWKANYNIAKTMDYMRNPNPDETIYICGEAYSDQQGWVEGAFCVAERMLEDHFDLDRPKWIPSDYYLGW